MVRLDQDKPAATILWPKSKAIRERLESNTSTPIFDGQLIFWPKTSGELACLDALTAKPLWINNQITDLKPGNGINITPAGDFAYLYTSAGDLFAGELTKDGFKELGRAHVIDPTYPFSGRNVNWSPPAYANQKIFARSDK